MVLFRLSWLQRYCRLPLPVNLQVLKRETSNIAVLNVNNCHAATTLAYMLSVKQQQLLHTIPRCDKRSFRSSAFHCLKAVAEPYSATVHDCLYSLARVPADVPFLAEGVSFVTRCIFGGFGGLVCSGACICPPRSPSQRAASPRVRACQQLCEKRETSSAIVQRMNRPHPC
jgi:hypothetical protein